MLKIIANDGMDSTAASALTSLGFNVDTDHYEGEALVEALKTCDALIVRSATKVRKALIDQISAGSLKLIIRAGVGIDNIDHVYAESQGIAVHNTPNASSASVAELTLGHMFTLARHMHKSNISMSEGHWLKKEYKGIELNGKTLGIIGFGRIGKEVAKKASALGMKILYYKRSGPDPTFPECLYTDLDVLLSASDFVTLHVPFTKGDAPILTRAHLNKMKPSAYLINTARGGAIAEIDIIDALNDNKLAGVALDVFEKEPTPNQVLWDHPQVSLTPHIGASTKEAQKRIGEETIAVLRNFFDL